MAKTSYLDSIDVQEPCNADWEQMIGDEKKRFCSNCEKNVYNLSAMSRQKARKLVANNEGKICVRYARLPNGKLYTTDKPLHQITRRTTTIAAGVIATTLSLSALSYSQGGAIIRKEILKENEVAEQNANKTPEIEIGINQISFTILDIRGAVIPGAGVKLKNVKTKQESLSFTDNNGTSQLSALVNGRYSVEITNPGFQGKKLYVQISQAIEPNVTISLRASNIANDMITVDYEYETPFFHAIEQEDIRTIETLLATGFDVNTKNKNGLTGLHVAVESESFRITELLLQNGANVDAKDKSGRTPLMELGYDEDMLKTLELLIKSGADVNVQDKEGKTPLMHVIDDDSSNIDLVRLLLQKGAKVNHNDKEENTALMLASDNWETELVELLLKAGAKPNVKNKENQTPLTLAEGDDESVEILRRYGAIK